MPVATVSYTVVDDRSVSLNVQIGDGQTGGIAAFLGTALVAEGPEIVDHQLGEGAALRDRVLVVSTTVLDLSDEHDRTSVVVQLSGGRPATMPIVQAQDTAPGGAVNYLTVVRFVGEEEQ